jgi:GNAT superfamily N-acetyltransferase
MRRVRIAECRAEDLQRLEAAIPSGPSRFHQRRFTRQQEGAGTYLIAWLGGLPVGHVEIRWNGCNAAEVRERFPRCPELNALGVWPEHIRSQGTGTALIAEGERRAAGLGFRQIGLGVADDNPRAAALYLRLGFHETNCRYLDSYEILGAAGARHVISDPCRFLVKDLG